MWGFRPVLLSLGQERLLHQENHFPLSCADSSWTPLLRWFCRLLQNDSSWIVFAYHFLSSQAACWQISSPVSCIACLLLPSKTDSLDLFCLFWPSVDSFCTGSVQHLPLSGSVPNCYISSSYLVVSWKSGSSLVLSQTNISKRVCYLNFGKSRLKF